MSAALDWNWITGGLGTLLLGVAAWWSKTRVDKRAAQAAMLEQQRKDFDAFLQPYREEVGDLRVRVTDLEKALRSERDERAKERDIRERIVGYTRQVLWMWFRLLPDHAPPRMPESIEGYFN